MLRQLLLDEWRFLTFRTMSPAIRDHPRAFFAFGFFCTWLAGIGRYWDNPRAELWQILGLGSIAYVFVLALFMWALIAPLNPRNWSYRNVLLFITLTAPPAALYAIPVEKFMTPQGAALTNAWFLGIVATWRVALYVVFLRRTAGLSIPAVVVGALIPLTIIVVALTVMDFAHRVATDMGGLREDGQNVTRGAHAVVDVLSLLSVTLTPIVIIAYAVLVNRAQRAASGPEERR